MKLPWFIIALLAVSAPAAPVAAQETIAPCDIDISRAEVPDDRSYSRTEFPGNKATVWSIRDLPISCALVVGFDFDEAEKRDAFLLGLPMRVERMSRLFAQPFEGPLHAGEIVQIHQGVPLVSWWQGPRRVALIGLQQLDREEPYVAAQGRVCILITPFVTTSPETLPPGSLAWIGAVDELMDRCLDDVELTPAGKELLDILFEDQDRVLAEGFQTYAQQAEAVKLTDIPATWPARSGD